MKTKSATKSNCIYYQSKIVYMSKNYATSDSDSRTEQVPAVHIQNRYFSTYVGFIYATKYPVNTFGTQFSKFCGDKF